MYVDQDADITDGIEMDRYTKRFEFQVSRGRTDVVSRERGRWRWLSRERERRRIQRVEMVVLFP